MAKCPICKEKTSLSFRPFCSRRCADIDLNRWFDGSYAVPVEDSQDDDMSTESHEEIKH